MAQANQKGEKLVKVSLKQSGKLRNFFKRVQNGIKSVVYAPGALFETIKDVPKAAAYRVKAKVESDQTDKTKQDESLKPKIVKIKDKEDKKTSLPKEPSSDKDDDKAKTAKLDAKKEEPEKTADKTKEPQPDSKMQEKEPIRKIEGKKLPIDQKNNLEENEPAKPVEIAQPKQMAEKDTHEENKNKKDSPKEEPKKEKKALKDLTVFDSYEDYKYAYFWNYYINKYDADMLDEIANNLSKVADAGKFRSLLSEVKFIAQKAEQVKALEIDKIEKEHEEEMEAAETKRKADVQDAIDKRQAEVDNLNDRLTTAKSKNRTLTSKLRVDTEALEQIKEIIAPLGIQKIADVISQAEEKCNGIDERAKEREKTKEPDANPEPVQNIEKEPKSTEEQVDDIMNVINQKVYGDTPKEEKTERSKDVEPQIFDDKKPAATDLANVVSKVAEQKANEETPETKTQQEPTDSSSPLVSEMDDIFGPKEATPESDNNVTLESQNPDYPGTMRIKSDGTITSDWKTSPINEDTNEDIYVPDAMEITKRMLDSEDNITYEEAKEQLQAEHAKQEETKGKTK